MPDDAPIVPDSAVVSELITYSPYPTTIEILTIYDDTPVLPPSGTYAAGGPTRGQLLPIGTR